MVNEPLSAPRGWAVSAHSMLKLFPYSLRDNSRQTECFMAWTDGFSRILTMAFVLVVASSALAAEDGVWRVSKSSGEVWMTTSGTQQASLTQEEVLKPGDTIRTGHNGRVLLVRGEETILVSPNSVIGLPTENEGRAVDHDPAAGRFDPAGGRKAQRQAFRGRDALSRRRGQGNAVSRLGERRLYQRRRA